MKKQQFGVSLLELMVAITIFGILVGLAVPGFREFTRNNRVTAAQNDLVSTVNFARSEALKRSTPVAICSSDDGESCSDSENWNNGWIVFVDRVPPSNDIDADDVILNVMPQLAEAVSLSADVSNFAFQPNGMTSGAATFALHAAGCTGDHAREFVVSITGTAAATKTTCPE
jgi:type IV fimbrial biogenesis protein FimT